MPLPTATLGLPAFNEETSLEFTVCSLLNQSYTDFELLLADNASTDDTMLVMQRLAASDSRIRILPADRNMGAVWNFRRLLEAARGEYFAWIGAHDVYDPGWLENLVAGISADEKLVLVYPKVRRYLPDNTLLTESILTFDSRGMSPRERVSKIPALPNAGERIYGLFRTDAARRYPVRTISRWDTLYLAGVGLLGDIAPVETAIWYRKFSHAPSSAVKATEAMLERQLRSLYPEGQSLTLIDGLASIYQCLSLLADGFATCRKSGIGVIGSLSLVCLAVISLSERWSVRLELQMLFRQRRAPILALELGPD